MPARHGMTLGELARLFNAENEDWRDLDRRRDAHWSRDRWFDETGLEWINPSPNMRNLIQATLYPGIGAIECATCRWAAAPTRPFEQLGAPWIDGRRLAEASERAQASRRACLSRDFHARIEQVCQRACQGVFFVVTDREALRPVRLGLEVAAASRAAP